MGIMHRDVKPHNVMIDHEHRKVSDKYSPYLYTKTKIYLNHHIYQMIPVIIAVVYIFFLSGCLFDALSACFTL